MKWVLCRGPARPGANLRTPDGDPDGTCALKLLATIPTNRSPKPIASMHIPIYIVPIVIAIAEINPRHSILAGLTRSLNIPKGFSP